MATTALTSIKKLKGGVDVEEVKDGETKTMSGVKSIILDACNPKFMQQAKKFNYKLVKLIKKDEKCMTYESELQPVLHKNLYYKSLQKIRSRNIYFKKEYVNNLTERLKSASLTSLQLNSITFSKETILDGRSFGLNHFRQLTNLTLKFDEDSWFNKEGLMSLSKNLQFLPSLKSLTLSFYFRDKQVTNDQALDIICKGLKHLRSLSSLYLFPGDICKISDEGTKNLSKVIQALPSLADLTLKLSSRKSITSVGMENLLEGFTSLQTVRLDFEYNRTIKNFSTSGLKKVFQKLCSLKTLDLSFECSSLEDQGLEKIFKAIPYIPSLSELRLDFSFCSGIENFIIEENPSKEATGLEHISKFVIDLRKTRVQYNGLNSIFKWVQNLKSLTTFEIQVDRYKISDESDDIKLEEFQQLELNSLSTLKFMFQSSDVNYHKMLQKLFFALGGLRNLQILHIDLVDCKCFEAEAGKGLGDLLAEFPKLSELCLYLGLLTNINAKGCLGIFRGLENLKCLSNLEILLPKAKYSGLKELKDHLIFLSNLKKLHLNFSLCKIVQEDAEALCESFASLTSLSTLQLDFAYTKLSDNFFKNLAQSLKSLNNPKNFEFYLTLGQASAGNAKAGITNNGFMFLMQGLSEIPNLSKLNINFGWNRNIDNTCLQSFAHIFKKLIALENVELNFSGCYDIEEHEFPSFIESVLQVKTLTCLKLDFSNCNINKASMEHLSSRVRRIGSDSNIML